MRVDNAIKKTPFWGRAEARRTGVMYSYLGLGIVWERQEMHELG